MGVTFPNETPGYREARAALLQREVALRREMEAVAALLRALPPGGEVPEDYSFDCIDADGAPSTVRLSELFRGGDTLMLYHYMFPRHAGIGGPVRRPVPWLRCLWSRSRVLRAPRWSTCGWERCPISRGSAATLPWSQRPQSSEFRRLRATRDGSTSDCCLPRTTPSSVTTMARARMVSRRPS